MESFVREALRLAIHTEKSSRDFYRYAAGKAATGAVRKIFEQLAGEEAEHLAAFLDRYEGDDVHELQSPGGTPGRPDPRRYGELPGSLDGVFDEAQALRLALGEEQACIDCYSALVETLRDAELRAIFEQALDDTRRHHELIRQQYRRLLEGS